MLLLGRCEQSEALSTPMYLPGQEHVQAIQVISNGFGIRRRKIAKH